MTDGDDPVTVSDLGPSDGHRTPWGSPYGTNAVVLAAVFATVWLLLVVVMHP